MAGKPIPSRTSHFAVLDLGGSKIVCFIARYESGGVTQVLGVGHQLSRGIKGGVITDIAEAETSILSAIHAAEQMAGVQMDSIYVAVSMPQIQSRHIRVELALGGGAVNDRALADAIQEGRAEVAEDEYLLHCLPFSYTLDDHRGIGDPRGMLGEKLITDLLLVTVPRNLIRNLAHCFSRCHLEAKGFVAAPYAAALSCLQSDEKDLGVTLLDMGGSTTGYAVFQGGKLLYTGAVPAGSNHITQDLAHGLNTSLQVAERLKTMHGSATITTADDQIMVDVPLLGEEDIEDGNVMPRSAIIHIIRPRLEEIFEMVRQELEESGLGERSGRRMVLTGGGSQLIGMTDLANKVFGKQSRVTRAKPVEGLADAVTGPAFSTALGMLEYMTNRKFEEAMRQSAAEQNSWRAWIDKLGRWLSGK
jgi:cell division protein FtsA